MSSLQKAWSYQCDYWLKNSDNRKIHVKFIKTNKYGSKTLQEKLTKVMVLRHF
jgi:hypothetical protein